MVGYIALARCRARQPKCAAIGTGINTSAKLLMRSGRFCGSAFTPMRAMPTRAPRWNESARSTRGYCARTGSPRTTPHDSARFSILAAEWPEVRDKLRRRLGEAPPWWIRGIALAWILTLPASALLSGLLFAFFRGVSKALSAPGATSVVPSSDREAGSAVIASRPAGPQSTPGRPAY